ncbi:mutator type transposase [Tanacetum coccineum]
MQKKFHVLVSKTKAFKEKGKAQVHLRGDVKVQYSLLRDYVSGLQRCNPDTTFKIDVYGEEDPEKTTRIQMLTAVGVDVNNGIYPMAYGIMESENQYSWTWFLTCLGDDFDLFNNSNFTFFRQAKVIEKLFPSIEHRFCVRHINENMNLTWKGGNYKEMLWRCATSTTVVRKWEILGIPCKHAIAVIHDMADNGMDVGTPEDWVYESYKLQTWMNIYSHKFNPVNGTDMWSKFDCPTTLLPPKMRPQIGRPPKKRKKSKGEIEMVKGDKLTRKGKTVTCSLCQGTC